MFVRWQKRSKSIVCQVVDRVGGTWKHVAYLGSVNPKSLKSKQEFWGKVEPRLLSGEIRKAPEAVRQEILKAIEKRVSRPRSPIHTMDIGRPEAGAAVEDWMRFWAHISARLAQVLDGLSEVFGDQDFEASILHDSKSSIEALRLINNLLAFLDALPSRKRLEALKTALEGIGTPSLF